jgi:hypothetical protein
MNKQMARKLIREHCGQQERDQDSYSKGEARVLKVLVDCTRVNTSKWQDQQIEDSRCSSAINTIAIAAGLSRERTMKALRRFQKDGLIVVYKRTGIHGQDEYTVTCECLAGLPRIKFGPDTHAERQHRYRENQKNKIKDLEAQIEALQMMEVAQ